MGYQSKADLYQRTIDSYPANCYSRGYSAEFGSRISSEKLSWARSYDLLAARWGARRYFSPAVSSGALPLCRTLTNYLAGAGWLVLHFEASYVD